MNNGFMGSLLKLSKVAQGDLFIGKPGVRTKFTNWCYTQQVKRATVTFPDDLAKAVDNYQQAQDAPPSLTNVVQAALREYLLQRGFLASQRPFRITPIGRSGRSDISREHDAYLAGTKK
jgi:hypothetical protein